MNGLSPLVGLGDTRATAPPRGYLVAACIVAVLGFWGAALLAEERAKPGNSQPFAAAQAEFAEAQKLVQQGLLESARAAVERGLKQDSRSIEGLNLLGIIRGQQKAYDEAAAAFGEALKLNPRSTITHNNLGNLYVAQNKLEEAEKQFRASLALEPRNRDANFNLGLVLVARRHPEKAVAFFRAVEPADTPTLLNLTQAYLRAGERARALDLAGKISARGKDDVRLHFSLGVVLASEKQYGAAIREFELADALQPGTFEILHDLGQAYLRNQNYPRAEEVLDRALKLQPDSAETLYLEAQVYAEEQKTLQALELLLRARKLAPQNTDIIFLMGRLSMMQNYFEDAIQVLENGIKIAPQRADLHAALGESYFTAGKVDKAIQEFETLIQLDPSARSYAFAGLCYRHLGRFEEAKKYFNQGLAKDPRNSACLFNLGYIENKQGNYQGAEKLLNQALEANPNYDDALYELAGVKMTAKKYEEAVSLLRRYTKVATKQSQAYYKLATAERALHQTAAAERDMKIFETLAKDPSSGPYPFQHLFDYLSQRISLPAESRAEIELEELEREVERRPNQPRNLYLLAESYLKLGRREEGLKAVQQLDQLSGGDFRTLLGAGVLLARHKLYPQAIEHFEKALAVDPGSDDAKYNLAEAYYQLRDYARALEIIRQVSPPGQNDDSTLVLLGDIEAHLGRTSEAARVFEKAIEKDPDNDRYYLSFALNELRADNTREAGEVLRRGLGHTPDSGRILWGLGIQSALDGKNAQAEEFFKRAMDLMPEWQGAYSALGMFYYQTGQIAKARQALDRYVKIFPNGGLDVRRVRQVLEATPGGAEAPAAAPLSAEARAQFLALALALADQTS